MELDPVKAIRDSRPPATDYMTYLTILESHLSAKVLPELEIILQDEELTQNIGWDLVHLLLPFGEVKNASPQLLGWETPGKSY